MAAAMPGEANAEAAPAKSGAADDLLSQLAGDEIDRLLAESESGAPPPIVPPPPESKPKIADEETHTSSNEIPTADVEALLATVEPLPPEPAVPDSNSLEAAPGITTTQNADSAASASSESEKTAAASSSSPDDEANAAIAAVFDPVATPVASAKEVKSADPITHAAPVAKAIPPAVSQDDEARVPFYIRILEIINLPMASASDQTRSAIGKVALMTLVNAIAVLAYLMIFRRK